jgi:hypothetical protein
MFTATLYFLGMAGCLVAASVCLSIGRLLKVRSSVATEDENPAWYGTRTWDEMKATFIVWYVRCQEREAANRKTILSWARTLLLCAGLCLIGVCLEVQFDQTITSSQIVAGLRQPHIVSTTSQPPQSHLPESKSVSLTK